MFRPLYLCPDCEGSGTIMYAGPIIWKRCSQCSYDRRHALTGADRIRALRRAYPFKPSVPEALRRFKIH